MRVARRGSNIEEKAELPVHFFINAATCRLAGLSLGRSQNERTSQRNGDHKRTMDLLGDQIEEATRNEPPDEMGTIKGPWTY